MLPKGVYAKEKPRQCDGCGKLIKKGDSFYTVSAGKNEDAKKHKLKWFHKSC